MDHHHRWRFPFHHKSVIWYWFLSSMCFPVSCPWFFSWENHDVFQLKRRFVLSHLQIFLDIERDLFFRTSHLTNSQIQSTPYKSISLLFTVSITGNRLLSLEIGWREGVFLCEPLSPSLPRFGGIPLSLETFDEFPELENQFLTTFFPSVDPVSYH